MNFHPYSEIFPLLPDAELAELARDIGEHGLREAIWTYQGQILDGRNRYLACEKAGEIPEYREYKGKDPLGFVVSLNITRRHLTNEQRAMAAARIATLGKGGDPNASREALTQEQAAEQMHVSRSSVQRAKPSPLPTYLEEIIRLVEAGQLGAGIQHVEVRHDAGCALLNRRGPCNCHPSVNLARTQ
ncbi:MAG: hypothetical protein QM718_04870 [Steroidobacteraceae bacterium]